MPGEGYTNPDLYEQRENQTPLVLGPITNHRWCYATAKQLFERYMLAHHLENGLPFTIVRPYNWFGPRMDFIAGRDGEDIPRVIACFVTALLDGQPLRLVDGGSARRTITYIDDAIDALMLILDQPEQFQNQIFNIGNRGAEVTISELAHLMRELAAETTGRDEFLHHPIKHVSSETFYGLGYEDCDRRVPDIGKAKTLLGWEPKTGLRETLRPTIKHYFETYIFRAGLPAQAKAGSDRSAVPPIGWVTGQSDLWKPRAETFDHATSVVGAAILDDDHRDDRRPERVRYTLNNRGDRPLGIVSRNEDCVGCHWRRSVVTLRPIFQCWIRYLQTETLRSAKEPASISTF